MSAVFKFESWRTAEAPPDVEKKPSAERVGKALIQLEGVTKTYDSGENAVQALRGVDVKINRGEFLAIIGPSGSGKSTLMHILGCLDSPSEGRYWLDGEDVATMSGKQLARIRNQKLGFVFQFFNLLPMLTAEENVLLPLSIAGEKPDAAFFEDLIQRVGLADRRKHRPSELSGGQQQRVAIARALVARPTVVFADEPTGNLDSSTGQEILELLRSATEQYGQTTVMVTHDAAAAAIADRILFLADGLIADELARSEPSEILATMNRIS
jgi:putative ABC transport system ATP-binding protein